MKPIFLFFALLLNISQFIYAQATFIPNQEEFLSTNDWKNKVNWTLIDGVADQAWPSGNDIIVINNSKIKLSHLKIDFDLNEISESLTYQLIRQNFSLIIGNNGKASFNVDPIGSVSTTINVYGHLIVNNNLSFIGNNIKMNIYGTLDFMSDLTFNNANNLLRISKGAKMNVMGNFNSNNGGKSLYSSDGILTINGDYTNNGGAELEILDNGEGRIKGNLVSTNGGGGDIEVYGVLVISQSVDFKGSENINVYENGCLIIEGNVFLTCNGTINGSIKGKIQFGEETKCTIEESQCWEGSPNNQLCEKINEEDLPIELSKFYGVAGDNRNLIYWQTSTEINNSHFELENSNDLSNWVFLDSIEGAGNINTTVDYSYVDSISLRRYYRLKQVDFDNNFVYTAL